MNDAASAFLAAVDDDWARLVSRVGPCKLEPHTQREPYEALVRAIAYQQLHGKAAEAILGRLIANYPDTKFPQPEQILSTSEETMRAFGFSRSKVIAIKGIAAAALEGAIPTSSVAETMNDEELIRQLVTLRGVGRWTVEMLLIFTLGRPDVLPVDDFGVREGWRKLKGLPAQPKPRELAELGKAWNPHRSTAAWYLWRVVDQAADW